MAATVVRELAVPPNARPVVPRSARRRSKPLVVELVGLPGAGKSTIAREAAARLRDAGLTVADDDLPRLPRSGRLGRYARFMLFCARRPRLVHAVARYAVSCRPWSIEQHVFIRDLLAHAFGANESRRGASDVVLLSQGAMQAAWSLGVGASGAARDAVAALVRALRLAGVPDCAAVIDVPAVAAAERLAARAHGASRFDRLGDRDREARLHAAAPRMAAIELALRGSLGDAFTRLDGRVAPSANGAALCAHIEAARASVASTRAGRVALFVPDLTLGGAERVMVNLSRGFIERGLEVDLLLVRREGIHLAEVPPEVRIITLGGGRTVFALPSLVRYLRRERPMALLSTLTYANVVAIMARRLAMVDTPITVREANSLTRETAAATDLQARVMPALSRWLYPAADAIVAVSRGAADSLADATGTPRERIHVLDNPIVTAELCALAREPVSHPWMSSSSDRPVIVAAGRLTQQKDFATLLRAFSLVRENHPVRLIVLGEGELRESLEGLARELSIDGDVSLPGVVRNPFAYMSRAALFVLSSAWEGSPGVLIQAMACGAPVVATDCESGPREILAGGRFGALVPVADVNAMAAAMDEMLRAPRRPPAASWSRFSVDAAVDSYLSILGVC